MPIFFGLKPAFSSNCIVVGSRWHPLAPVGAPTGASQEKYSDPLAPVGIRWHPLARQRAQVRGNTTIRWRPLAPVGTRWHPLARQRAKVEGKSSIFAIRWRPPRLAYIIIIVCGVGAGGVRGCPGGSKHCSPGTTANGGPRGTPFRTHAELGSANPFTMFVTPFSGFGRAPPAKGLVEGTLSVIIRLSFSRPLRGY